MCRVSVCCPAYNHEKVLAQAIESFLAQETDFSYEILVRDDCSTDGTAEVIRRYERKYPGLVRGIYEPVNGRSQGVLRVFNAVMAHARGEYIAICDGDDHWSDPRKLQKQYDYMEAHPGCTFCFHNALRYDERTGALGSPFFPEDMPEQDLDMGGVVKLRWVPACAFFFRRGLEYPGWFFTAVAGDLPMSLLETARGYAHYIPGAMAVYRVNAGSSTMDGWKEQTPEEKAARTWGYIQLCQNVDCETRYVYHRAIAERLKGSFSSLVWADYGKKLSRSDRELVRVLPLTAKCRLLLRWARRSLADRLGRR